MEWGQLRNYFFREFFSIERIIGHFLNLEYKIRVGGKNTILISIFQLGKKFKLRK